MGVIYSYFTSSPEQGDPRNLLELLNAAPPTNWALIQRRLQSHPEEACCYGHFVDSSLLQRAFVKATEPSNTPIPHSVVKEFLQAYPETVFHHTDETVLHTAVRSFGMRSNNQEMRDDESAKIVKLLLQENPEMAHIVTRDAKMLPLHFVRQSTAAVAELLIAMSESSSSVLARDVHGRLPLHHACSCRVGVSVADAAAVQDPGQENGPAAPAAEANVSDDDESNLLPPADPEVIQVLLEAARQQGLPDGGVLTKDNHDKTPFSLLCDDLCRALDKVSQIEGQDDEKDDGVSCGRLWDSLTLLVEAVESSKPQRQVKLKRNHHQGSHQILHALISLGCPTPIVRHALSLYPHQVQERDNHGRTPLMMATACMPRKSPSTVCLLLQAHPAAARMTDDDGRLPIDILSERPESYDEEVWELMVKAEPRAVDTRDLRDKMFPFMTAALHSNDVNTIYCLLRAKPHVLTYFSWDE